MTFVYYINLFKTATATNALLSGWMAFHQEQLFLLTSLNAISLGPSATRFASHGGKTIISYSCNGWMRDCEWTRGILMHATLHMNPPYH